MPLHADYERPAFERASRRWHTESVGTQLLRALAEAEERDAAVAKRTFRVEVKAVNVMAGVTHAIQVLATQPLELLCLELEPSTLSHFTCVRLQVGSLIVVEGAPLELLNRAWLSRFMLIPGVGLTLTVENRSPSDHTLQGCVVGIEPERKALPYR